MTNPDNIVRVRARNGGRASVYEANGWCQAYGSGILDGTGVVQNTVANMTVLVGGSSSKPDVLVAQNPAGYKIALDLVGQHPVTITAPASNSRISAIVAYTDDLALESTEDTVTGSPASCGLIVVNGSSSASPSAPTDTQIRSAITSDGATGSQASYAIIATIRVASNTTSITDALITRNQAGVQSSKIDFTTLAQSISNPNNAYIQIGTILICYGQFTASGIGTQAYSEKAFDFNFPKAFSSRPQVFAAVDDIAGFCGEYAVVSVATTTKGTIVIGHTASTSGTTCRCGWLAIGAA